MPRPLRLTLIAAALCLLAVGVTFARSLQQGEDCTVPADTVVKGSLFIFCQNLRIAGRVEGNVIGIGLRAQITGEVGRNVYLAGLELAVTGEISRDLHFVGLTLDLASPSSARRQPVRGQVLFAALSAQFGEDISVPGPITGLGYQLLLAGKAQGEISYWGSAFVLSSEAAGDVYAAVGNPASVATDLETLLLPLDIELSVVPPGLVIMSAARIHGQLEYYGPVKAEIDGGVDGAVTYYSTRPAIIPIAPEQDLGRLFLDQFRRELAVLLTMGLLGVFLAPKPFRSPLRRLRWRPAASFVIGMLLFIVSFPITLIMILITAIPILLLALLQLHGVLLVIGSLLILIALSAIGIFYFTAIFVARAVFALGLGRLALQIVAGRPAARQRPRLCLLAGVVLLAFLASLPEVGFLFNAVALFMGLGAIASAAMDWLHAFRGNDLQRSQTAVHRQSATASQPIPDDTKDGAVPDGGRPPSARLPRQTQTAGLEDLPDGFDPDFLFADD